MSGLIRLEKLGKPGVYLVTDNFGEDARLSAEDNLMPKIRVVTVPAKDYYMKRISREQVKPVAEGAFDAIIVALTKPLTAEESHPATKHVKTDGTMKVTAETYEAALEKFNQLFLDNHWGSGLPLIPPTAERVKWMLKGTSRSPKEVIGTVPPKNGIATIEKIAVNAVMAGARPEYLPVIIAAMEAVADKKFDLFHMQTSTGSFSLLIQVNGPIAKEIEMQSGIGFLGYGWRANNTIGHAVRLSLINLGHVWPGENDMGLIGRPSSHTFFTYSENESLSPWEPFHVSLGYKPEDSCVTVATMNAYTNLGSITTFGGGAVLTWNVDSVFKRMIDFMKQDRAFMTIWKRGSAISSPRRNSFFIPPELAIELDRRGYTKKKLQQYFYEQTSIPYEQLTPKEIESVKRRIDAGEISADRIPVFKDALKPGGKIPLIDRPEDNDFIVTGGFPAYVFGTFYFSRPLYSELSIMTKKVTGATLTKSGRK
ncbi:MAG: hypothetical protein A4E57_02741 [Syntrophorhabdaceae bacterium PtaU1.Bin034]|nr:MAG: hypothetical protein A4E57_02741 [Syntrophorhabdaceae bacterium PtaU1.Bin034]